MVAQLASSTFSNKTITIEMAPEASLTVTDVNEHIKKKQLRVMDIN